MGIDLGRTAAILPGGGCTGIYQVGFFKAIDRLKINLEGLMGASAGLLNAAGYIANGSIGLEAQWLGVQKRGAHSIFSDFHKYTHSIGPWKGPALYNDKGLIELVKQLNMEKIVNSSIKLYAAVWNRTLREIEIKKNHDFRSGQEDLERYREFIESSSRFPGLFRARKIGDYYYGDGLLISSEPFEDFDTIFVVRCDNPEAKTNIPELYWDENLMDTICFLINESIETEIENLEEVHGFKKFPADDKPRRRAIHKHIFGALKSAARFAAGLPANKRVISIYPTEQQRPTLTLTSFRGDDLEKALRHSDERSMEVLEGLS